MIASTTRTSVRLIVVAAVTRFMTCIYPRRDTMKLNFAQAIPPALPEQAAPYGTLMCSRQKCRALLARHQATGGLPKCPSCGAAMRVHPASAKPPKPKATPITAMPMGDASVLASRPMFRFSPVDYWDANNECPHGQLPHQVCEPCGQAGSSVSYPGFEVVAALERAA